jgi:hypothetical protein
VNADNTGPNLVPPPPPRGQVVRKRKRQSDRRMWMWPLGLLAGVALGVAAYQFIPNVDFYFDYWIALLFS